MCNAKQTEFDHQNTGEERLFRAFSVRPTSEQLAEGREKRKKTVESWNANPPQQPRFDHDVLRSHAHAMGIKALPHENEPVTAKRLRTYLRRIGKTAQEFRQRVGLTPQRYVELNQRRALWWLVCDIAEAFCE